VPFALKIRGVELVVPKKAALEGAFPFNSQVVVICADALKINAPKMAKKKNFFIMIFFINYTIYFRRQK
jgi:hypothetical protein